jgi:hypothetical protein
MNRLRNTVTAVLAMTGAAAGSDTAIAMTDYKWKYRPLVIFASDAGAPQLVAQRRIVAANRSALAERDIVVVWVVGNAVSAEFGPTPRENAASLLARFGAEKGDFRAVLIGKDGGAKLTSASPITADRLYATVDAMPMRRNEMRR